METKTATTFNPCDDCPKDGNTCPVCTLENAVAAGFENRARISQLEAQLREREAVAQNGHPNPCDLGPMCPYCEIERQNARAESAEAALAAAREELAAEKRLHATALASNKQLRQELAALKSRSEGRVDDEGRVERAARLILESGLTDSVGVANGVARAVLVEADREGE